MKFERRRLGLDARPEPLEGRRLLAAPAHPTSAELATLRRDFEAVRDDIARMQVTSHVTRAEIQALAADARGTWATGQQRPVPHDRAAVQAVSDLKIAVSYSFIEAGYRPQDWADKETRIESYLATLGSPVPAPELDRVLADLRAIAGSAGVSAANHDQYIADTEKFYSDAIAFVPATATSGQAAAALDAEAGVPDPEDYFNAHLSGFIPRGRVRLVGF